MFFCRSYCPWFVRNQKYYNLFTILLLFAQHSSTMPRDGLILKIRLILFIAELLISQLQINTIFENVFDFRTRCTVMFDQQRNPIVKTPKKIQNKMFYYIFICCCFCATLFYYYCSDLLGNVCSTETVLISCRVSGVASMNFYATSKCHCPKKIQPKNYIWFDRQIDRHTQYVVLAHAHRCLLFEILLVTKLFVVAHNVDKFTLRTWMVAPTEFSHSAADLFRLCTVVLLLVCVHIFASFARYTHKNQQ